LTLTNFMRSITSEFTTKIKRKNNFVMIL
jgi:hypothetical protein